MKYKVSKQFYYKEEQLLDIQGVTMKGFISASSFK